MAATTFTVGSGVFLTDNYIAANYPGGDTAVYEDMKTKCRTIATNRGYTIDENSWQESARRAYQAQGLEFFVTLQAGDITNGVRYRVVFRIDRDIP